ncbi:unnamed protein product [Sphenostylis stenocarpa]|uniref:GH18 domain-containing protein n=1 Tax=Sphenostylis stenocarpa TaxID=92480 RepID=A0AA86W4Z8_9FABA|nr:unnamed protein product [Sphenostylis stenocarpa]
MMECKRIGFAICLSSLFSFSTSSSLDNAGIGVYWGQDIREGKLNTTCDTGNYAIVLLAYLRQFGDGRNPFWDFIGHDDGVVASQIKHCQAKGVKVFLSIGGPITFYEYSLNSTEDAKRFANYLYTSFLSGRFGPIGRVELDGIEFHIRATEDHWDDLVKELDFFRRTKGRYFHLVAAPRCQIPVHNLGKAIATKLFDHIFVQFYNDPSCEYNIEDGTKPLLDSWDNWVNLVASNNSLFLALPADSSEEESGFVEPDVVNLEVLPHVKKATNYGGVILYNRYRDIIRNFSGEILPNVPKSSFFLNTMGPVFPYFG